MQTNNHEITGSSREDKLYGIVVNSFVISIKILLGFNEEKKTP